MISLERIISNPPKPCADEALELLINSLNWELPKPCADETIQVIEHSGGCYFMKTRATGLDDISLNEDISITYTLFDCHSKQIVPLPAWFTDWLLAQYNSHYKNILKTLEGEQP